EALGNRDMLVAGLDLRGAEAALEQAPHRRHEGRAAGEEHLVDLRGADRGLAQGLVERPLDAGEISFNPSLEGTPRDLAADARARRREVERRLLGAGQRLLRLRDGAIERIALLAVDELDEALQPLRLQAEFDELLEVAELLGGPHDR